MESRYVLVQYFEKYKHRTDFFIVANVTFFFFFQTASRAQDATVQVY